MEVSKFAFIAPIVLIIGLIVGAVWILEEKQVQQVTAGYNYKEKLFLEDKVGEIDIEVAQSEWQKILDDPTAEEYVSANVTINGETFENVGVRAKGNSSLMSVANSDSERYSLKVDFSQYSESNTYYGLEKLNLNNSYSDSTQMKEFVSYELLEQMGIDVPAHSYVKVMLNGDYYGLMLAVEEIGAAFAKTTYGSTEGFIFKPEDEGADLVYVSDDTSDYSGIFDGVKMNKDNAKEQSNIIQMLKEISEGITDSLNIEQVAKYFAINTALVNLDSYQGQFNHNYYLYEDAKGKFSIIPWDYNMSFGGFGVGMGNGRQGRPPTMNEQQQTKEIEQGAQQMPPMNGMMQAGSMMDDSAINFTITEPVSGTTVDERPLLKIVLEDEEMRQLYEDYLQQFATTVFTEQNIAAITASLKDLLLESVEEDPSKFFTTDEFLAGVEGDESLATFAKLRSESILQQLAGEIEGVSGSNSQMPEGFTPPTNGEMPEGFTPPKSTQLNAEVEQASEMAEENSTNGDSSQNEKDGGGAQFRGGGNMPVPGGNMNNPFGQQQEQSGVTAKTLWTIGISLLALIISMFAVNWLSNRKYKR